MTIKQAQNQDPVATEGNQDNTQADSKPLVDLVETLDSIDTKSPEAKLNETSVSDGKGGRIELVDDPTENPEGIKK